MTIVCCVSRNWIYHHRFSKAQMKRLFVNSGKSRNDVVGELAEIKNSIEERLSLLENQMDAVLESNEQGPRRS